MLGAFKKLNARYFYWSFPIQSPKKKGGKTSTVGVILTLIVLVLSLAYFIKILSFPFSTSDFLLSFQLGRMFQLDLLNVIMFLYVGGQYIRFIMYGGNYIRFPYITILGSISYLIESQQFTINFLHRVYLDSGVS